MEDYSPRDTERRLSLHLCSGVLVHSKPATQCAPFAKMANTSLGCTNTELVTLAQLSCHLISQKDAFVMLYVILCGIQLQTSLNKVYHKLN